MNAVKSECDKEFYAEFMQTLIFSNSLINIIGNLKSSFD